MSDRFDRNLVTTANDLAGHRVTHHLGVVRGLAVRSRSLFGSIGATFQTMLGGNISLYAELCEQTRQEAFDLLIEQATRRGANAILALRFDANEVVAGVTEVLAYGTAVVVERAAGAGA